MASIQKCTFQVPNLSFIVFASVRLGSVRDNLVPAGSFSHCATKKVCRRCYHFDKFPSILCSNSSTSFWYSEWTQAALVPTLHPPFPHPQPLKTWHDRSLQTYRPFWFDASWKSTWSQYSRRSDLDQIPRSLFEPKEKDPYLWLQCSQRNN